MFQSLWKSLTDQISGPAAADAIAAIARHHRIQASPGYRRAAEWVLEEASRAGLEARLLTFPANAASSFWGTSSFQEWEVRSGVLHLTAPTDRARKLADFREMPLNVVARSLAFEGEAELAVLDKGTDANDYEGLDVRGRVVLARGSVQRVHDLAVLRRGAVGLIYDGMTEFPHVRPVWALPDTVQYTSFWWQGQEPQGFGFAVTPRTGEELRRLAREQTLRVRASIDARLYDGTFEVVEAVIPGTTEEEIVLVAHLCHPQPSANDNASGVATLLEVARALAVLIGRGELAPPRRTIRFLWLPEMTGTYAYLAANEDRIPRMVAGLNLDMVGQDQEQCGSSLLIEEPPDALANFTAVLLNRIREHLMPEVRSFNGTGGYPLFRHASIPFAGGSDHYVFSDPSVGIPMPMVIQWPDRYWHTSGDTMDRVDPQMLHRVGCLSGVYAYWLSQAGRSEATWLAREMSACFRQKMIAEAQTAVTRVDEEELSRQGLGSRLDYLVARHGEALARIERLAPVDVGLWQEQDAGFVRAEFERVADLFPEETQDVQPEVPGADAIVRPRFRGPAETGGAIARQSEADRDWWAGWRARTDFPGIALTLAEYWADGRRSIAEIAALVQQETGAETTTVLVEYFGALSNLGFVEVDG